MAELENTADFFFHVEAMHQAMKERMKLGFKHHKFPLTIDQWTILKCVAENNGNNQQMIADTTLKDPAAITRILDILIQKGFAKRMANTEDRRSYIIQLTVDGQRLYARMLPVAEQILELSQENISTSQLFEAKTVISKLIENFES